MKSVMHFCSVEVVEFLHENHVEDDAHPAMVETLHQICSGLFYPAEGHPPDCVGQETQACLVLWSDQVHHILGCGVCSPDLQDPLLPIDGVGHEL